jgi:hypothetical protein
VRVGAPGRARTCPAVAVQLQQPVGGALPFLLAGLPGECVARLVPAPELGGRLRIGGGLSGRWPAGEGGARPGLRQLQRGGRWAGLGRRRCVCVCGGGGGGGGGPLVADLAARLVFRSSSWLGAARVSCRVALPGWRPTWRGEGAPHSARPRGTACGAATQARRPFAARRLVAGCNMEAPGKHKSRALRPRRARESLGDAMPAHWLKHCSRSQTHPD